MKMAFNANFRAAKPAGESLLVVGQSVPPAHRPIMVTCQYEGELYAERVQEPLADPWTVMLGPGTFEVGKPVHLTGVAVLEDDDVEPFTWHDRLDIVERIP